MGPGLSHLTFSHTQGQMVNMHTHPFACDDAKSGTLIRYEITPLKEASNVAENRKDFTAPKEMCCPSHQCQDRSWAEKS